MAIQLPPRLLVVDDDPGVIAAYRIVLEQKPNSTAVRNLFGLDALEMELFGGADVDSSQMEWRVKFVDQGADAVAEVKQSIDAGDPFAAIFLDVRMPPGMDGYEAAEKIRKLDQEVHIVIVTGYSDYTFKDLLEVAGPEDKLSYMAKPVWPDELRKVAHALTRTPSHRSLMSPHRVRSA